MDDATSDLYKEFPQTYTCARAMQAKSRSVGAKQFYPRLQCIQVFQPSKSHTSDSLVQTKLDTERINFLTSSNASG